MIMKPPSEKALELLLKHEVGGGKNYYEKYLSGFTWPGGASGPTIAIGIDCAYYTKKELEDIFHFLDSKSIQIIQNASGKKGISGKEYTKILAKLKIKVSWEQALEIFNKITWPKFSKMAETIYPDLNTLCDDAYGAIVSLVFNRGTSLKGDSRLEMRNIKDFISKKDYKSIANEIRKMKRLWLGKNLDGLIRRREDEAILVESCL